MGETDQTRQKHGLDFENWLKATFFEGVVATGPTDKWDFQEYSFKNKYFAHTASFKGLPISVKTCQYKRPINFGDAIRQFENNKNFLLIVGFWMPDGSGKKFVAVKAVKVLSIEWKKLFEEKVSPDELDKDVLDSEEIKKKLDHLDSLIKNTKNYKTARKKAREAKKAFPSIDIVLNPKIDSKNQRRLQCSLPFNVFWETFAKEAPFPTDNCMLWGEKVPILK